MPVTEMIHVSLENFRSSPGLDPETIEFSARLCVDGIVIGTVKNVGKGRPHEYFWKQPEMEAKLRAWAAGQPPMEFADRVLSSTLDRVVTKLVKQTIEVQELRRVCKRFTAYRLEGDEEHVWRVLYKPFSEMVREELTRQYGSELSGFANDLAL